MSDLQKELAELLENAMKQPGVVEVIEAYESQKETIDAYAQAQAMYEPQWIVTASTSSKGNA